MMVMNICKNRYKLWYYLVYTSGDFAVYSLFVAFYIVKQNLVFVYWEMEQSGFSLIYNEK